MTRAFIIGNGPSIAHTPLAWLSGEVTFAMNRINLIYGHTPWRPTYYVAFDFTGPDMVQDMLVNVRAARHSFIRADRASDLELYRRSDFSHPPRVTYMWTCREHLGLSAAETDPVQVARLPSGWHFPEVCGYASTLNQAVQLAVLMGFRPIYLLGCDLGFRDFAQGEPDPNHFDGGYVGYDDFAWNTRDATLLHMHGIISREARHRGIPIRNLTPSPPDGSSALNDLYDAARLEDVILDSRI